MIGEIIPASTKQKHLKLLSPGAEILEKLPSVKSHISFLPFLNYLKEKLDGTSGTRADFYRYVNKKIDSDPALLQQVQNVEQLAEHEELLEFISAAIFPVVSNEEQLNFTLSVPYQFNIFSYSKLFRTLFIDAEEEHLQLPAEISEEQLRQVQCAMIYGHVLDKYYGIQLNDCPELVFPVTDGKTGMKRFYRMRYDRRFIDLQLTGKLPLIQDCAVCLNTFRIMDLEHQLKSMPLHLFKAEGFAVWIAEDITLTESLEGIKKILLRQNEYDTDNIDEIKYYVQTLIGLSDIDIGIMPFFKINNNYLLNEDCTRHSLIGKYWQAADEQSMLAFQNFIRFQKENPEPMPVSIVDETLFGFAPHLKPLYQAGVRSYVYYPMQNSDGILGMLELASAIPNHFTQQVMARLEPAIPLISLAMLKSRDCFNNRMEKIVKEKFTALQSSVEWKFSEVAWAYLQNKELSAEPGKIIFENVYPLYGAIDIRNSSIERNLAIQKDLIIHLNTIDDTLDKLQEEMPLTLLEGLRFKNRNFLTLIENVLIPEDEIHITEFILTEVQPLLIHLQKNNSKINTIAGHYFALEKNSEGMLYHYQNEYELTLTDINQAVNLYLEEQEKFLQKSYPHYFEKYRTDGIEYNIYMGQSMAPQQPFDLLYLKNIRLWQIQSMAEIAKLTHALIPKCKVPLQTTQLILIHNQPISISFRKDERRFDVEGSYNIRYEVMKKRIDKALVKDNGERLTQPGKIALVYSNQKDALEYEEYIHFLQSKNLLRPGIENLDLEDMQGLKGMKALRVDIVLE